MVLIPVEVHGLRRVIFVRALSVPTETLTQPVGRQEIRAGQTSHLGWPGSSGHSGVQALAVRSYH